MSKVENLQEGIEKTRFAFRMTVFLWGWIAALVIVAPLAVRGSATLQTGPTVFIFFSFLVIPLVSFLAFSRARRALSVLPDQRSGDPVRFKAKVAFFASALVYIPAIFCLSVLAALIIVGLLIGILEFLVGDVVR